MPAMTPLALLLLALVPDARLLAPWLTAPRWGCEVRLGADLALEGDTLLVGGPWAKRGGPTTGTALVWRRADGEWCGPEELSGDGRPWDRFGCAVDLADGGRIAVVGAFFADGAEVRSGVVHLFERGAPGWDALARLAPRGGREFDAFGWAVDLDRQGRTLLVGGPYTDAAGFQTGAAWVYRLEGGSWVEEALLVPSDAAHFDHFGWAVAWAGERALVGAPDAEPGGRVYTFLRSAKGWTEGPVLEPPPGGDVPAFGSALAAESDRLAVGIPGADRVQVLEWEAGGWAVAALLEGAQASAFGRAVALSGADLLVGAPDAWGGGAAHAYRLGPAGWTLEARLGDATQVPNAGLGSAVALDAALWAAGAPWAHGGQAWSCRAGAVQVWER